MINLCVGYTVNMPLWEMGTYPHYMICTFHFFLPRDQVSICVRCISLWSHYLLVCSLFTHWVTHMRETMWYCSFVSDLIHFILQSQSTSVILRATSPNPSSWLRSTPLCANTTCPLSVHLLLDTEAASKLLCIVLPKYEGAWIPVIACFYHSVF